MRRWRKHGVVLAALCAAALAPACSPEPRAERDAPRPTSSPAPVSPRASLILEPRQLHLGETTAAEIAVVTPPDHRVLPIAPSEVPGLWLQGMQTLPVERGERRWVHRTRFRLRPRELGPHTWPGLELTVETPEGERIAVTVASAAFEVLSVRPRFPGRDEPFGLQRPDPPVASGGGFGIGLALGAASAGLLGLVAFALVARARRGDAQAPRPVADAEALPSGLREWADAELTRTRALLDEDARRAANQGSRLVRAYMARRFGSESETSSTEELLHATPSLAERALWSEWVRVLQHFDDERFRRPGPGDAVRLRGALDSAQRLIEASLPREHGRRSAGHGAEREPGA